MLTFGLKTNEIPEIIVSRLALRYFIVRLGFDGMDDVGELDSILNEENRNIVGYKVPISFVGVKLHGKAANISNSILK